MEKFEHEGKKYWQNFRKSLELLPRQYFNFVSTEKYSEFLEKYDLRNKKVLDIGAGYPAPKELGKKLMPESFPEALRNRISVELKEVGALFIEK